MHLRSNRGLHSVVAATLGTLLGLAGFLRQPAPALAQPLRVALVMPGPIDDGGWSQSAYDGLRRVEREIGAHVAYRANVHGRDAEAWLRTFGAEGYDLVIAHGGEYLRAAEHAADAHGRTKFAVVEAYAGNNRNLGALSFRASEGGYLAGVAAALKTRLGKVAYVGGTPLVSSSRAARGFVNGVRAVNPALGCRTEWVGGWNEPDKARNKVRQLVGWGADVFSLDLDLGMHGGQGVAEAHVLPVIRWSAHQQPIDDRSRFVEVLQHMDVVLLESAKLVLRRRFEGKQYKFGLREGALDVRVAPGRLTAAQQQIFDRYKRDLRLSKLDPLAPPALLAGRRAP